MYQDDPGAEFMMKAWSQGTDWTARILRIFLFTMSMTAFVFSVLVFQSCAFMDYSMEPLEPDSSKPRDYLQFWRYNDNNETTTSLDTSATLGLYRYSPNNVSACIEYGIAVDDLPTGFQAARIGSTLGILCGAAAGFLMLVEFICCRFWCSRVIIVFLVLFASIFQLVTFALFAAETCHPNGVVYACSFGEGATYALISAAFFAVTSFLTCITPKAVPIAHVIQDMERYSIVDPCCCLPGRSRQDVLEEHASLMKEENLPSQVIEGVHGYEYKQYYDSKAGVTLQDQLRAAYTQWLACEHEYDQTLDRFKQECRDAGEASWREVMKRDDIRDEILARLVWMLDTQRIQCERAKEDLERFRLELDIATTPIAARDIEMVEDLMIVEGFPEEEETTKADEIIPSSSVRGRWWSSIVKPCQWQRTKSQNTNENDSTKHRPDNVESSGNELFHSAKGKDDDEIASESGYETPDSNTRKNGEEGGGANDNVESE